MQQAVLSSITGAKTSNHGTADIIYADRPMPSRQWRGIHLAPSVIEQVTQKYRGVEMLLFKLTFF